VEHPDDHLTRPAEQSHVSEKVRLLSVIQTDKNAHRRRMASNLESVRPGALGVAATHRHSVDSTLFGDAAP
jgi:hypothetical protein